MLKLLKEAKNIYFRGEIYSYRPIYPLLDYYLRVGGDMEKITVSSSAKS